MRVLLDECLPKRLKRELTGHEVHTVPEAGWAGKENGELMQLLPGRFEAFITVDRNLQSQQNFIGVPFGVVVLRVRSNRLGDLQPLVPQILEVPRKLKASQVVFVSD